MSAKGKMTAFRLYPEDNGKLDLIADLLRVTKVDALRLCIHQFDSSTKGVAVATAKRMDAASFGVERIGVVEMSPRSISKREIDEIRQECGYSGTAVKHKPYKPSRMRVTVNTDTGSIDEFEEIGDFSLDLE